MTVPAPGDRQSSSRADAEHGSRGDEPLYAEGEQRGAEPLRGSAAGDPAAAVGEAGDGERSSLARWQALRRGQRTWRDKFADAGRGVVDGIRAQSSFWVHLPFAAAVIALAVFLQLPRVECCVLLLCVALVLTTEFVNTALESLAKAADTNFNPHLRLALDVAAGAVLVAAVFSAVIGCWLLLPPLWSWFAGR